MPVRTILPPIPKRPILNKESPLNTGHINTEPGSTGGNSEKDYSAKSLKEIDSNESKSNESQVHRMLMQNSSEEESSNKKNLKTKEKPKVKPKVQK